MMKWTNSDKGIGVSSGMGFQPMNHGQDARATSCERRRVRPFLAAPQQKRSRARSRAWLSVLTALMFSASAWAQSQSTLLDRGIYAEDSLGDLDKAIEIYEQILGGGQAPHPAHR